MRPTTRTIALYVLIAMSLLSTLSMNAAMAVCFNALSLIVLAQHPKLSQRAQRANP